MSFFTERSFLRLALAGALVASLGLAACGRKGPLDPPPSASAADAAPAQRSAPNPNPFAAPPLGGVHTEDTAEQAPTGPNKSFFLDGLLN